MTFLKRCRSCNSEKLEKFLSLGETTLANTYLSEDQLNQKENKFPLETVICEDCKLVQLSYIVPPELMFKNYLYVTSTTKTFREHFTKMAEEVTKMFNLGKNSLVVDIGSNDGLLLKGFQNFGVSTIGVEPAENLISIALENGVETINDFFNENVVDEIIKRKGKADVVTGNNVFAHIHDIKDVVKNVKNLLKDNGIFIVEVQYLVDKIQKLTFDNIYHEHLTYYTLTTIKRFFEMNDMEVFNVQRVDTHGGSIRVFVQKKNGKHEVSNSINNILEEEKKLDVENIKTYEEFAKKVYAVKSKLLGFLDRIKKEGKSIVGYGAPAKATTLLGFCGIGTNYLDYIVEDNPLKHGLYTSGGHIPIVNPKMLDESKPEYALILAWNFTKEILEKNSKYREQGIKFIIPLPEPRIV